MTQEEKQLLLKDLCARLPYGVILQVGIFDNGDIKYHNKKLDYHSKLLSLIELDGGYYINGLLCKYPQFTAKPYLRPISSMTKEEEVEWFESVVPTMDCDKQLDFYCKHHFDYRGLIPMGLAIESPERMYEFD